VFNAKKHSLPCYCTIFLPSGVKDSYQRVLPIHIHEALQKWAMVTKEKSASALSYNPSLKYFWSDRQRDAVFGANYRPLATKFTGFSMCHPIYDDGDMLDLIKHALHSSLAAQTATATNMFLPNWKGMSTNAYMKVVINHPESCTILGHIPQTSLT